MTHENNVNKMTYDNDINEVEVIIKINNAEYKERSAYSNSLRELMLKHHNLDLQNKTIEMLIENVKNKLRNDGMISL